MASIAEILMEQGRLASDARRARGALTGSMIAQLTQVPGAILQDRQDQKAAEAALRLKQEEAERKRAQDDVAAAAREEEIGLRRREVGIRESQYKDEQDKRNHETAVKEATAIRDRGYNPELIGFWLHSATGRLWGDEEGARLAEIAKTPDGQKFIIDTLAGAPTDKSVKTREIRTRNADGSESVRIVEDAPGFSATSAPPPAPEPRKHVVIVKGPNGRPMQKLVTEDELTQGIEQYEKPSSGNDNEPLVAIVGPDGKSVLVPRSQAVGKQPANSREQGRPVTSGDASDLSDFDTGLDDVTVLRNAVSGNKATGTMAKLGTMTPNAVTEMFGWGADAKMKNAVIARVKQVIGKTLEGGVLRKEDEEKYKDILPTIGDVPEVVTSKLNGLEAAIKKRKQRRLDALADAGYDTSKYQQRSTETNTGNGNRRPLGPNPY